jgi:hypothetical protein
LHDLCPRPRSTVIIFGVCMNFQLSAFFLGNLDFFTTGAGYRTRGSSIGSEPVFDGPRSHPAVTGFRLKAASYLTVLNSWVGNFYFHIMFMVTTVLNRPVENE